MYARALRRLASWTIALDRWITRVYPQDWDPLYYTGGLSNLFLVTLVVSGVFLFFYYEAGLQGAYASVQFLTDTVPYGLLIRGIHRYAADAFMIAVLLHLFRNWFTDRYRGARDSPWLSGVVLVAFTALVGVTGYLLVWDQRAQAVAGYLVAMLRSVPGVGAALTVAFLGGAGVGPVMLPRFLFLHIGPASALFFFLWWHYLRIRHPKVWPPATWVLGTLGAVFVIAGLIPALSDQPATPAAAIDRFTVDWLYMWPFVLMKWLPAGTVLGLSAALVAGLLYVPYSLREPPAARGVRAPGVAKVVEGNCTGCELCYYDCPYNAIVMVPSPYPGDTKAAKARKLLAVVVDPRCVECGICIGACPFEALELPRLLERDVLDRVASATRA